MISELTDTFLHVWPWILLSDFLRYLIPVAVLSGLLMLFHDRIQHRRIQARDVSRRDRWREVLWSMSTVLIFSLVGLVIFIGEQSGVFRVVGGLPEFWPGLVSLILMIVAHDSYFYWAHRLMHDRRLFQRFHRLHHLSRTPRATAAYAFAIPEAVVEALFFPLYLLLIETSSLVVFLFLAHMILRNVAGHAGHELFPRRWIDTPILNLITTTTHHDLHHESFRYNYGLYFTLWDRWMGTEHPEYKARFLAATAPPSKNASAGVSPATVILALLLFFKPATSSASQTCDLRGLWVTQGFSAIVFVDPDLARGRVVAQLRWVFDEGYQVELGKSLFSDMRGKNCSWSGGKIFNPENKKTYRGEISLAPDGRLKLLACLGPFCKTQHWRRYRDVYESLPVPPQP